MRKQSEEIGTEPIRIRCAIVKLVRDNKKKTGFPIGRFIEDAIEDKIEKIKQDAKES